MEIEDDTEESVFSKNFQKYRHILHPYRLTMMQILYLEEKISSVEIRHRLKLSWQEFYSTAHALNKLKLVKIFDDFDEEGFMRQHMEIEDKGRLEYFELISVIDKFVETIKEAIPDFDKHKFLSSLK